LFDGLALEGFQPMMTKTSAVAPEFSAEDMATRTQIETRNQTQPLLERNVQITIPTLLRLAQFANYTETAMRTDSSGVNKASVSARINDES
jgi:hypothetical protein